MFAGNPLGFPGFRKPGSIEAAGWSLIRRAWLPFPGFRKPGSIEANEAAAAVASGCKFPGFRMIFPRKRGVDFGCFPEG